MKLSEFIEKETKQIRKSIDFTQLENKSILITGATGIIGSYLVACLKNFAQESLNPPQVFIVFRNEPSNWFKDLIDFNNLNILKGDLGDIRFVDSFPVFDFIVHAGGYGQPGKFMSDELNTFRVNLNLSLIIEKKLSKNGSYLFLSTSEVYNGLENPGFKESQIGTTNTNHPRSSYIEAKRCGEAMANSYKTLGYQSKSARLSLAYGPGTKIDDHRVINDFIRAGILNNEIKLRDSGNALRTYIYVLDAVEMLWNILFEGKEDIYNVGGISKTSIADLAKEISSLIGCNLEIPSTNNNSLSGAPMDVNLDISRYVSEFGKARFVSLEDGLSRTIQWQKLLYS